MDKQINESAIPAAEWMSVMLPLLEDGLELKLMPKGVSMIPFLAGGRDEAVLVSARGKRLRRRDIVLYAIPGGVHVLHRIHHINGAGIYTLGDFQDMVEGPYAPDQILAVAKTVIRKGRAISCEGRLYNLLVELWMRLLPLRPVIIRLWRKSKGMKD